VFSNAPVDLTDVTSNNTDLGQSGNPALSDGGAAATWPTGSVSLPAGHQIRLTATNVTNPPGGTYELDLATSADTTTAQTAPYTIGGSTPTVTSVSPSSGPTGGGNQVTITGTNLSGAAAVKFGTVAAAIVSDTATQITATAPAGSAGTVDVTVTTPGGTSASSNSDKYTYVAAPTVTAVSPTAGPTGGGNQVTITGTNLSGATAVNFGGTQLNNPTVNQDGSITVTAPAGSAGPVDVTVTTPGGTSAKTAADRYSYFGQPAVTSVNPNSGPTSGGNQVKITGNNLAGATAVNFGGTQLNNPTVNQDGSITVTAPTGSAGTVDVTVTTPGGTSATGPSDRYTYQVPVVPAAAPSVTGVSPSSGPAGGGTGVTITGTSFTGATAVRFGNAPASSFKFDSDTQITAVSPPGSGTVDVTVTTPAGTSQTGAADRFTYVAGSPAITPGSAGASSSTAAVFSGQVNPNGQTTTVYFVYGLDKAYRPPGFTGNLYDQSTTPQTLPAGISPDPVQGTANNLIPNALYHVRLAADNGSGPVFGPDQTFTTPQAPPPPPPVLGKSENATPTGNVFLLIGGNLLPLTEPTRLPSGTIVDALNGTVNLAAATGKKGQKYTGTFGGAVFKITQTAGGGDKGLTTLTILEGAFRGAPSFAACTARITRASAHAALSSRILQTLRARASGRFRTRGRYAAATVRGTQWTTTDRCDGTLIAVQQHAVQVQDLVKHITKLITQGHSYLAKAPGHK
jgi:hypothetical protein